MGGAIGLSLLANLFAGILSATLASPASLAPDTPTHSHATAPAAYYLIDLKDISRHRIHVEMICARNPAEDLEVWMPVWTPGSYKIRDYARHIENPLGDGCIRGRNPHHQGAKKLLDHPRRPGRHRSNPLLPLLPPDDGAHQLRRKGRRLSQWRRHLPAPPWNRRPL